jgi:hypothetical protein
VTRARLTLWIFNSNENLQHAIAGRQSNFQACSFNHSDISPLRVNGLRAVGENALAGMVLGYGGIATMDIQEGLRRLGKCFGQLEPGGTTTPL